MHFLIKDFFASTTMICVMMQKNVSKHLKKYERLHFFVFLSCKFVSLRIIILLTLLTLAILNFFKKFMIL
jgi:hypothetical protein